MQKDISPEEKLLNLIKGRDPGSKDVSQEKSEQGEPSQEPISLPKGTIPVPRKKMVKEIKSLSILNKFFILCLIGATGYTAFCYIYPYKSKVKIPERFELRRQSQTLGREPKLPPSLSYYADVLSTRQMFKLYEAPKPTPTGTPKQKVTLQQLLSGYTFVGVIYGEVPQAIVEEKRSGQSFYLIAGQSLGEIKIEKIERGKITISYEEERMEISI